MAKEFNEQQLQPAAEYIAKNFEREARRLAKEVGPLAVGLPKAMRRAVQLNKVRRQPFLPLALAHDTQHNILLSWTALLGFEYSDALHHSKVLHDELVSMPSKGTPLATLTPVVPQKFVG